MRIKSNDVGDASTRLDQKTGVSLARIEAGAFVMGCSNGSESERPLHSIELDEYWLACAPVTNEQFGRFVNQTAYQTTAERSGLAWGYSHGKYQHIPNLSWRTYDIVGRENHPVVLVTWDDASAYCMWAGFRLPTEAEWEYACRGGMNGCDYPWGNVPPNATQCNWRRDPDSIPPTTPVTQFPKNGFELFDMVGNVWQWCSDWFAEDYYANSPQSNPNGPASGEYRVRRGGAWNVIQPFRLRVSNRGAMKHLDAAPNVGFRCALPASKS